MPDEGVTWPQTPPHQDHLLIAACPATKSPSFQHKLLSALPGAQQHSSDLLLWMRHLQSQPFTQVSPAPTARQVLLTRCYFAREFKKKKKKGGKKKRERHDTVSSVGTSKKVAAQEASQFLWALPIPPNPGIKQQQQQRGKAPPQHLKAHFPNHSDCTHLRAAFSIGTNMPQQNLLSCCL